jgi:F0F1-type ATP synthase assembly protein I
MLNEEEILKDEAEAKVEEAKQAEEEPVIVDNEPTLFQSGYQTNYKSESVADTIRKSGLAYSAALALLGSVVFMMIIGWVLDTFFGTSPWLLVGGIVLGSVIGFYQFFKITSEILKNKD